MPYATCLPNLVLIAQLVFLLERGQRDEITDAIDHPTSRRRLVILTDSLNESKYGYLQSSDGNIILPTSHFHTVCHMLPHNKEIVS